MTQGLHQTDIVVYRYLMKLPRRRSE